MSEPTFQHHRPDWPEYFLAIAELVSSRAACTRRRVGAVLVSPDNRIIDCGYNGTPAGEINCTEGGCPRGMLTYDQLPANAPYGGETPCTGMHAESNAIVRAGFDRAKGATLYSSQRPCSQCSVLIRAVGIAAVITPEDLIT